MDTIKTNESVQDIEHGILRGGEDIYEGDFFLFIDDIYNGKKC